MESQSQNPEFRNNPENFHQCTCLYEISSVFKPVGFNGYNRRVQ